MSAKLYVHVFIFSIFIILCIFTLATYFLPPYRYMDGEYSCWMQQKDYLMRKDYKQEILFLGDSRMKAAILPRIVGDDVYNLAIGGATSLEMYYSLKIYLDNHPKPKMVFIAFAPIHYEIMDCYKSRTIYFHYLPLAYEQESQNNIFLLDNIAFFERFKDKLDNFQYHFKLPTKYGAAITKSIYIRRDIEFFKRYKEIDEACGHMYFGRAIESSRISEEGRQKDFQFLPSLDFYFRELIKLCKEEGIQVQIEQLPMNEATYNVIRNNGYLGKYEQYMTTIAKDLHVPVEKNIPCYKNSFFGDAAHLNEDGVKKFSREIKNKYLL